MITKTFFIRLGERLFVADCDDHRVTKVYSRAERFETTLAAERKLRQWVVDFPDACIDWEGNN